MKDHIVLIGADGATLPADSTDYVAIQNTKTGLMACAALGAGRFTFGDAQKACAALTTAGFTDWRLPTVEELFPMADRTRFSPAVDPEQYPFLESDWYWSGTVDPSSPSAYAFGVDFYYGSAYINHQACQARALLVRSAAASASQ